MEQGYLHQVLPFLKDLSADRRRLIEDYFNSAPVWLMDAFQIIKMDKDVTFIRENTPVEMVYIIGEGTIRAVDFRIFGIRYEFMRFSGIYAMGGMEVVMDLETYRTTLQTATPCIMIALPRKQFAKWLETDIKALKQEAKAIGEYLLEDGRRGRALLFMQASDRLSMLFVDKYEEDAINGILTVTETRQEIAEESGLCVKTVNRAVKKLEEEQIISRNGNKIIIDNNQYLKMQDLVAQIIDR